MAEAVSLGEEQIEPYAKPGKDEISLLSVTFNRMRESLKRALGYAWVNPAPDSALRGRRLEHGPDPWSRELKLEGGIRVEPTSRSIEFQMYYSV